MENKLRVGIAGVGGVGHRHIDGAVFAPHAELVALFDPRGQACVRDRDKIAKHYHADYADIEVPNVPIFTDYTTMLEQCEMDAVIIASPDETHCQYTIQALKKGLHVLCEKPLALNNKEAVLMVQAARESGKGFYVGQVCRFSPAFRKAKEILESGKIGDVFCVETQYVHGCHKNLPADDWRRQPPRHATACGGVHAIDLMRYFIGDPKEVFAVGNRMCRTDWEVEDCSEAIFKFPNGAIGRALTTIGCVSEYSMRTVIYGTKGTVFANNTSDTVTVYTEEQGNETYEVPVATHNTTMQIEQMCQAVLFGATVEHEGLEGAKSLFVCDAAIHSIETGEVVQIDFSELE